MAPFIAYNPQKSSGFRNLVHICFILSKNFVSFCIFRVDKMFLHDYTVAAFFYY